DLLLQAYEQEIKATGRTAGSQVTTASLLLQVALLQQPASFRSNPPGRSFRDYPRIQFRADLFALLASGRYETGRRRLRFAAGSDTAGAVFMLVPALDRAAHVGRLWFEGDE